MKLVHTFALVLLIAAAGGVALAVQDSSHQGDHAADAAAARAPRFVSAKSSPGMARMEAQLTVMREMHDKAMAGKTPEERDVLVAAHTKAIRDAMTVMNETSSGGMSGIEGDRPAHRQMMEKRLQMTQVAMQMAMDRLPAAPPK